MTANTEHAKKLLEIALKCAADICRDQAAVYDDECAAKVCNDCAEAIMQAYAKVARET